MIVRLSALLSSYPVGHELVVVSEQCRSVLADGDYAERARMAW